MLKARPTIRGALFAATGLGLCAGGWRSGQGDVVALGAVLALLPLAAWLTILPTHLGLRVERRPLTEYAHVGDEALVELTITNTSSRHTPLLQIEETVAPQLGFDPRAVLDRIAPGQRAELTYVLDPWARGRWEIGPLRIRTHDVFGLTRATVTLKATTSILVLPSTHPVTYLSGFAHNSGTGDSPVSSMAGHGADDVLPREYRYGDESRRVHWPATARAGELMIRREEQPHRSTITLMVDLTGEHDDLEWVISEAASIVTHVGTRADIRLVDQSGGLLVSHSRSMDHLVALALVTGHPATGVRATRTDNSLIVVTASATAPSWLPTGRRGDVLVSREDFPVGTPWTLIVTEAVVA